MCNEYQTRKELRYIKIYSAKIYSEEFSSRSFVNKVCNAFLIFGIFKLNFFSYSNLTFNSDDFFVNYKYGVYMIMQLQSIFSILYSLLTLGWYILERSAIHILL